MADNNSSPVCGACKFFLGNGDFGICRRFPSYEQRHASNWCGEHYPIPHVVTQPEFIVPADEKQLKRIAKLIKPIEAKKRGRPAKGKS